MHPLREEVPRPEDLGEPRGPPVLEDIDKDGGGENGEEGEESDVDGNRVYEGQAEGVERQQKEHKDQVEDGEPPVLCHGLAQDLGWGSRIRSVKRSPSPEKIYKNVPVEADFMLSLMISIVSVSLL